MRISIAQKIMPFSHTPGAMCLIPGTHWEIEAFPTLLRLGRGKIELYLKVTGPVRGFTLQQDLERDCVWIFGKAVEGFFRLQLMANDAGFEIKADRVPEGGIAYAGALDGVLMRKEVLTLPTAFQFHLPKAAERLSLGSHKAQDWDLVLSRFDLRDILPVLYQLGQKVPGLPSQELKGGVARLLALPKERANIPAALETFCRAGFSKILIPRLKDDQHQGLCPEEPVEGNRFLLLQEAFHQIRSLFFRNFDRRLSLLPCNPFDAGRLIGISAPGIGSFDLEWSKGFLRRAILRAETTGDLVVELQKGLKSFRVRRSRKERGKKWALGNPLFVETGKIYLLDRFQK